MMMMYAESGMYIPTNLAFDELMSPLNLKPISLKRMHVLFNDILEININHVV